MKSKIYRKRTIHFVQDAVASCGNDADDRVNSIEASENFLHFIINLTELFVSIIKSLSFGILRAAIEIVFGTVIAKTRVSPLPFLHQFCCLTKYY